MNETQRRRALADVKEFFLRAGALAALLLVLFGVVFGLAIQPDDTMYPHLKPGDLLLYYRLPRSFAAGEVVVFTQDDRRCTGRVAARGGDTVEVTENALLRINGSLVAEPDIYEMTPRYDSDVTYPLTLADGEYFILCDAREGAPDSRRYGPVTTENIAAGFAHRDSCCLESGNVRSLADGVGETDWDAGVEVAQPNFCLYCRIGIRRVMMLTIFMK